MYQSTCHRLHTMLLLLLLLYSGLTISDECKCIVVFHWQLSVVLCVPISCKSAIKFNVIIKKKTHGTRKDVSNGKQCCDKIYIS